MVFRIQDATINTEFCKNCWMSWHTDPQHGIVISDSLPLGRFQWRSADETHEMYQNVQYLSYNKFSFDTVLKVFKND